MGRLQGKVALITGAGAGIGRAAARLFALEGARIVIAELEPEAGRATEKQVREVGGEAHFVEMDVTDDAQVERAVSEAIERFGKLDVLYNCAGGLAALRGVPTHVYSAAKGGVISLTRSLAATYSRQGVRVNAICPGFVLSERVGGRCGAGAAGSAIERTTERYPFGVCEPIDIAQIALFLASDEAGMVTGAISPADGGMSVF